MEEYPHRGVRKGYWKTIEKAALREPYYADQGEWVEVFDYVNGWTVNM